MTTKDEAERLASSITKYIRLYPDYEVASDAAALLRAQSDTIDALQSQVEYLEKCLDQHVAEIESLKADALRYRWLRDHPNYEIKSGRRGAFAVAPQFTSYEYEVFKSLDAAIDAAMKQGVEK